MRTLRFAFAACTAAVFCGCAGQPQWTQFRLNPQHNAVVPGDLRVSWHLRTKGAYSASPTIVGSTLYLGNNDGTLYAIDVRNGSILWKYRTGNPLMSNPLIYRGLAIAGEGNSKYRTHRFAVGSGESTLFAVDARTGALRWSAPLRGSGMPTPAVINGLLIQHNGGRELRAFEPQSGAARYTVDMDSAAAMTAILPLGGDTFVTAGQDLNALQARVAGTGAFVWVAIFPKRAWGILDCPPATDGRFIFCDYPAPATGAPEYATGRLAQEHAWAVDSRSGKFVWNVTLESGHVPKQNLAGIPLVVDDSVYLGSSVAPYVHALATQDGRVRWRLRVHGPVKGGLVAQDGVVYFGDYAGYLWAVDAKTGKAIGSKDMHTSFNVGSPAIDGRTLVIGSNTGDVIAIPLDVIQASRDR